MTPSRTVLLGGLTFLLMLPETLPVPVLRDLVVTRFGVSDGLASLFLVANMIGAGVFLGAGFMAQEQTPGSILLAWVVGAILAMAGARAYAEAALLIPRSGGEYRYLTELVHPAVGYLAGWASLLVGFAAPMAISAFAAAAFALAVFGGGNARLLAVALIALLTRASRRAGKPRIPLGASSSSENSCLPSKLFSSAS